MPSSNVRNQAQVQLSRRRWRSPAALALLSGALGVGGLALALGPAAVARADEPSNLVKQLSDAALDAAIKAQVPQGSLAPLIKKVQPAVVSIRSFGTQSGGWFGGPARTFQRGVGSGFIIDAKGVVVTNHHVVAGADGLQVKLADGRVVEAEVLGSDPYTDLAVLQLRGVDGLPTVDLGDSDRLEVGDYVLAIGSPMGLEQTVTRGIVSAKGRGDLGLYADSYVDFVQTDAAISPGSSGGPLINMRGQVVAVNTAVSGVGTGLGFAVPVDQAKVVIPQLRKSGKVDRGWLGISGRDVEPALGRFPEPGAVIGDVLEGTPAAAAGLRKDDRIVALDGEPLENFSDLRGRIAEHRPGETVAMTLERDGRRMKVDVALGNLATHSKVAGRGDAPKTRPSPPTGGGSKGLYSGKPRLGVQVLPAGGRLEVKEVTPGSVAEQIGLEAGDVLLQVNGQAVSSVEDVAAALATDLQGVKVEVQRGDGRFVGTLRHAGDE